MLQLTEGKKKRRNLDSVWWCFSEPKKAEEPADKNDDTEDTSAADIQNPAEYRELFQVNSRKGKWIFVFMACLFVLETLCGNLQWQLVLVYLLV